MKKVLFVATLGVVLLSSCVKTRTCTCSHASGDPIVYTYNANSKKVQKADCDSKNTSFSSSGYTCKLD